MNFINDINVTITLLKLKVKEFALQLPFQLSAFLDTYFENIEPTNEWKNAKVGSNVPAFNADNATFSTSNKLGVRTGEYKKSFLQNNPNSNTKVNYSDASYSVTFGTKLRRLHESGGFIASKGNMHKFFFARYAETKNEFFKIVALSVLKKGGVKVQKREHFTPAMNDFNATGINELLVYYANELAKIINRE